MYEYKFSHPFCYEINSPSASYNIDDYDSPWKIALDNYLEEFLSFYFPQVSQ